MMEQKIPLPPEKENKLREDRDKIPTHSGFRELSSKNEGACFNYFFLLPPFCSSNTRIQSGLYIFLFRTKHPSDVEFQFKFLVH